MPYVANRPLIVDGKKYQPGEVVPGAEKWLRVESRVATGRLKWVEPTKAAPAEAQPAKPAVAKKRAATKKAAK